jgi:hypothetical protein
MADVWLPLATRKLEHEPFHRLLSKGGALDKARLVGITAKRDTVQLIISSQRKNGCRNSCCLTLRLIQCTTSTINYSLYVTKEDAQLVTYLSERI